MPERYEIRGQDLPDGNKSLSPKDVYNINKNFDTIGLELFGNINFSKDIDKKKADKYSEFHTLIASGFELRDENNSVLIETAKGIANEQNFGSTQNVESGFPLRMSFRIGDTTSVITSVELRLKQYDFRTDSKGAASGGGSTSGASSKSTSDSKNYSALTIQTSGVLYEGDISVHHHSFLASDLDHNHGMAHTHPTPAHIHPVDFGILEYPNTDGTIDVYIDGVERVSTGNTDTILDITTWITTNGIHNLSLVSPNMKRIQCDVFIKSYIRR